MSDIQASADAAIDGDSDKKDAVDLPSEPPVLEPTSPKEDGDVTKDDADADPDEVGWHHGSMMCSRLT